MGNEHEQAEQDHLLGSYGLAGPGHVLQRDLQLLRLEAAGALAPPGTYGIVQLGYPIHLLTLLGIWKMLGIVVLLLPKYPLLKEWAYAGFFFLTSGAAYAHIATAHAIGEVIPSLLLLIMTVLSWYFRPADRRLVPAVQ